MVLGRVKPQCLEENPSQCHFFNHKSHVNCSETEFLTPHKNLLTSSLRYDTTFLTTITCTFLSQNRTKQLISIKTTGNIILAGVQHVNKSDVFLTVQNSIDFFKLPT